MTLQEVRDNWEKGLTPHLILDEKYSHSRVLVVLSSTMRNLFLIIATDILLLVKIGQYL